MQTATDALKGELQSQNPTYTKTVNLYRKVWTGSEYVFDTPIDITAQIKDAGKIMWKLDKEGFNVWTAANLTLTLRNDLLQWKQDNPRGYFPSGYLLNGSKVTVQLGGAVDNGTFLTRSFEKLYCFTGYINVDLIKNTLEKTAVMTLESGMSIFSQFNGEDISVPLNAPELLGSNSGSTFTTAGNGVSGVSVEVRRGPTAGGWAEADLLKPTIDYTTENSDTKDTPMTVNLIVALTSGNSLWIDYRTWYTDKKMEWLVEQVMILCGISSYSISPAIFETNIPTTWTQTTEADWLAGTPVNIDINADGSFARWFLVDDFTDGNLTSNPTWNTSGAVIVTGGYLQAQDGRAYTSLPKSTGTWKWRGYFDCQANSVTSGFYFGVYGSNPFTTLLGYGIVFDLDSGHALWGRYNGGLNLESQVDLGPVSNATWHNWRVTRDGGGTFNIYLDGSLVGTASDTYYSSSISFYVGALGGNTIRVDDIYVSDFISPSSNYVNGSAAP